MNASTKRSPNIEGTRPATELVDRSNGVVIVPTNKAQAIEVLDQTSRAAHSELMGCESDIRRAMVTAHGMRRIEESLTPELMSEIMHLQNTPLGFRTDRPEGYKADQLRPVVVMALLKGLRLTGNEWNVIAGNLYVTREGFQRLLAEYPGLTNLRVDLGVPEVKGDVCALVPARAQWHLNGVADELRCEFFGEGQDYRIPIRVNKSMGVDAIIGKARSKLLRRIFERVTGSALESDADDNAETMIVEGEVASVAS